MMGQTLLDKLANRDLVTPYLDFSMTSDNWPDSYQITVDSSGWSGDGDTYFHPSSHALPKERFLYFLNRGEVEQERKTINSAMTLSVGTAMHSVLGTQLIMSGLCRPEDIEVPVQDDEHEYRGHIDAIINHPNLKRYVCDIKTTYAGKYDRLKKPQDSWVAQVNLYMYAAKKMGLDVCDEAVILCVQIGWPYNMKEFRIKYDPELLEGIFEKWSLVSKAVKENKPPTKKCCAWDSDTMKKCPARDFCRETYWDE